MPSATRCDNVVSSDRSDNIYFHSCHPRCPAGDDNDAKMEVDGDDDAMSNHFPHGGWDEAMGAELVHRGEFTRIYRLRDPDNVTFGGRTGLVAVKVLWGDDDADADKNAHNNDRRPDRDHHPAARLRRLYDEYVLSRRPRGPLSRCSAVRASLGHRGRGGDGPHATYLEWAPGITLREWTRSVHGGQNIGESSADDVDRSPPPSLYSTVRLAWTIAGSLSEIHEAGVVLNNVSADNIIVDTHHHHRGGAVVGVDGGIYETNKRRLDSDPTTGAEGEAAVAYSVKIIDLGSAALLKENDRMGSIGAIRRDLHALGLVLYEMFSGMPPPPNHHPLVSARPNPRQPQQQHRGSNLYEEKKVASSPPLMHELAGGGGSFRGGGLGFVWALISKLTSTSTGGGDGDDDGTGGGEGPRYTSAVEVQRDLHQMLDWPDRFLSDAGIVELGRMAGGVPEFPTDRLYGRAAEVSEIMDAYSNVAASTGGGGGRGPRPHLVLISGSSGTGKSCLVRHVRGALVARGGGSFLAGKFDSLRQVEPLSAVVAAFTEFCTSVLGAGGGAGGAGAGGDPDRLRRTRARIREGVGRDGASVLIDLIPGLRSVLGGEGGVDAPVLGPPMKIGSREARNRLRHMLRVFVGAIASSGAHTADGNGPLVMFFDDLQWADAASLEFIRMLATDAGGGPLLIIGCYRDDEVSAAHPLSAQLVEIERQGVPTTKIHIGSVGGDAMNHLISDALFALRSSTRALTDSVHQKTNGNVFFAIQFIGTLLCEGLLEFCPESGSWRWDLEAIRSKNVADTACELMTERILQLPAETRGALEVAACLGRHCDEDILELVAGDDLDHRAGNPLSKLLDVAVGHGLMQKVGRRYEFIHDQIQHAAYNLIPENQRGLLHLQIGKRIWKLSTPASLEDMLFVAADQTYLGCRFVDETEKIDLAKLYLQAGKKAMSLSLFLPASTYLKGGIELLRPGHWDEHYELSLQLYESCAEADSCNGYFSEMGEMLDEIFSHGRCFEDKIGAYTTLVNAFGARDNVKDAIETAFLVLEELGEVFPDSDIGSALYRREWLNTRDMLEGYSDETLLTMSEMKDECKVASMEFLKRLVLYTHLSKQEYFPLVTMRMMQLSLRYGLCKESSFAFAVYGTVSCVAFNDVKRGYQFGQLALKLLERFDSNDCLARVYAAVYGAVNHWSQPIRLSLEPLLYAAQVGVKFGDIEYAMGCARTYIMHAFQCGQRLAPLEEEIRVFCEQMVKYKQDTFLALTVITRQTVQNLMGHSSDPMQLKGEVMNQEETLDSALENKNVSVVCYIHLHRMCLAYLFGDYVLAADMAEKSRNVDKIATPSFVRCSHAYFDGLISLVLARTTKQECWVLKADEALEKLKNWAVHAPSNCQHKVLLLEAEYAFFREDSDAAKRAFDEAIAMAGENGFVHEQALACERAAIFRLEIGEGGAASDFFDQAHDLYLDWGARSKADHLRGQSLSFLTASSF